MSRPTGRSMTAAGFTAAAVLAALTATVIQAPSAVAAPPSNQYVLSFFDEFNGTSVDTAKWNFRTDVKGLSAQRPENVTVGGGVMTINLKKENFAGRIYTGGGLISKQRMRYGYYETRAKTQNKAGWHTAFWAQQGNGTNTFNPEHRTEIDGFENDSLNRTKSTINVIRWSGANTQYPAGCSCSGPVELGFDQSADFHTYGFEWTETQVRYFVDGVLKITHQYSPTSGSHDFINIWLTSIALQFGGQGVDESGLPGTAQFDYVRYYMRDGYTDNEGPTAVRYSETGTWADSALIGHTLENKTRFSNTAGATATWGGFLPQAGTYDVFIYKVVNPTSDTNSRVDVTSNSGTNTQFLDFTSGTSGWVKLGTFPFSAGASGSVKLTRGNNNARADSVKFIRVS